LKREGTDTCAEASQAVREEPTCECTIIVPCRNEVTTIIPFLDSLTAQEQGEGPWEILIADGDSDDGTTGLLQKHVRKHANVRVIRNPERIVSTGLNRAIEAARGEYIVRMDVHTVYASDYVRRCLEVIRATGAMNVGGPARTLTERRLPRAIAAAYGSVFAVGGSRFHFPSYEGPVDTVTYGCWRREDLMKLGLFDADLVRNQDDELNVRIRRAGGLIWQSPSIRSWYRPRENLVQLFRQYYQYGFWKVAVIRKHRMLAAWRHLMPAALVASLVLLLFLAPFWTPARSLLAAELMIYVAYLMGGALFIASRRGFDLLGFLPLVIAVFHISYGSGFLHGLLGRRDQPRSGMVDRLTR
jgi:succinoglycan biosynthesis protein ExoA